MNQLTAASLEDAIRKSMTTAEGVGGDFLPEPLAVTYINLIRDKNVFRQIHRIIKMGTMTLDFPKILSGPKVYYESTELTQTAIETSVTTGTLRLTARKFMAQIKASEELFEDANQDMDSIIDEQFAAGMAEAEEETMLVGDRDHTATSPTEGAATEANWYTKDHRLAWNGLLTLAGDIVGTISAGNRAANRVDAAGAEMSTAILRQMLYNLGKYGRTMSNIVVYMNPWSANQLMDDSKLVTVDKYGPKATIHTGEFGKLYGKMTVINSDKVTDQYAVATHVANVVIGDRRKIKLKKEEIIENDARRVVISQRADMKVEHQDALVQCYDLDAPSDES